jgi:N-acetylglucosaminyldiphosphoundecaprenol N-acetyl-beta-D-mannosaminyltransferase
MTTPDGMPMVWLCHWYGFDHVERVYGPDLMLAVCDHGIKPGYRHYLYGGAPGVGERLANCLRARFPGLQIVGIESPPFRSLTPEEESQIGLRIREACPDIVWVGISSPKQERWMAEHINRFEVPVMVGVGAAFDFLSGIKDQAPRWIQTSGFEWLYRLFHEPRRLWRRYILGYPRFIILIAIQMLKGRG